MKIRSALLSAWLVFGVVGVWTPNSDAESETIVVIVNRSNPASSLTASDLRPIFQATKTSWATGFDAIPLNLPEDNALRRVFDQVVLGLDPDRVARYWQDRKIRGGARAPKRLPSTSAVLATVATNAGALGYIAADEANRSVKVVAKIVHGKLAAP